MSIISNLIGRAKQKKEKLNEVEEDYNIHKKVADKQLSANERELNSYRKENRERHITRMLEAERKKRLHEWWTGHSILKEKNQFANQKNIFKNQKRLFRVA